MRTGIVKRAGAFVLAAMVAAGAHAAELDLPVPGTVVYPGQDVVSAGLSTRTFVVRDEKVGLFVADQGDLHGYVARRTLLPGKAIRHSDLTLPDAVKAGTNVTLIYRDDGLVITGLGTALQSGQEGETIRVRNTDSGITVSGRIAPDGTISIEG
ncbi:flagellar basal body P-ring formation chaperone FlgA [Fulvimarina sp. 2208YS6-2-32]|uniref:Flagella basal body P-ring formation protein FlgA n=1 Tax=Fulvimarina uroteuthidis TaxID=3098149 RepID=A0ABU5I1E9_9HYPH|nr:flagellar basal body P-ring formation chaperone FlgA [Fulvimarina sp. 2208YS6-2-32]MDY8108910.1 flagellar basal body P-ring formation chaperone FlgA [Fulvimarina sp. 2208YS6-2-32]